MENKIPLLPAKIGKNIKYSANSIVSKIIYQDNALQITLFAVAKDQSFDKHTTTKKALIHIIEGKGKIYLKDKWYNFSKDDYFYMPIKLVHALKAKTNFKFILYLF